MEPVLRKLKIVGGYAIPPDVPGHGIEFKDEALAQQKQAAVTVPIRK